MLIIKSNHDISLSGYIDILTGIYSLRKEKLCRDVHIIVTSYDFPTSEKK